MFLSCHSLAEWLSDHGFESHCSHLTLQTPGIYIILVESASCANILKIISRQYIYIKFHIYSYDKFWCTRRLFFISSSFLLRVIHIVCTHKEGGEGSSQMRTIVDKRGEGCFKVVYVHKNIFLDHKISKRFFFCTKEAITLPFSIVYRKV